ERGTADPLERPAGDLEDGGPGAQAHQQIAVRQSPAGAPGEDLRPARPRLELRHLADAHPVESSGDPRRATAREVDLLRLPNADSPPELLDRARGKALHLQVLAHPGELPEARSRVDPHPAGLVSFFVL